MFVLVQQSRLRELLFATSVFALSLPLVTRITTAASVRIMIPVKFTLAFILERKTVTDWIAGGGSASWCSIVRSNIFRSGREFSTSWSLTDPSFDTIASYPWMWLPTSRQNLSQRSSLETRILRPALVPAGYRARNNQPWLTEVG